MYGPRGRDIAGFALIVFVLGGAFAIGCERGCAWIGRRVEVTWRAN